MTNVMRCVLTAVVAAMFLFALAPGNTAGAASLLTLGLVVDGSVDPPGDRLDFSVFLLPDDGELTAEVRAVVVRGEDNSRVTPVEARGKRNRDAAGHFLATMKLARDAKSPIVRGRITIPYEDLDLPLGIHKVAYEITGYCGETVAFIRPSRLTRVTVSERRQRKLHQPLVKEKYIVETCKVLARLPGERQRDGTSTVEQREIELAAKTSIRTETTRTVAAEIEGGYEREEIAGSGRPSLPDETAQQRPPVRLSDVPWNPLSSVRSQRERLVYFATNRNKQPPSESAPADARQQFGGEVAAETSYGVAVVNFPVQHRKGRLEQQSWWQKLDPRKHFLVESLQLLSKDGFLSGVGPNDVLLFVHGFNNTFDNAVLQTAQLGYDLEFPGVPVAFSWPSAADLNKYEHDGKQAEKSVDALAQTIRLLSSAAAAQGEGPKPKLHVIAHSMGNRLLLSALYELYDKGHFKPGTKYLGQVVLAAPDVGSTMFNNLLPYTLEYARQVTYYYCSRDTALSMSRTINYYEPVGLLPFFERGLDTVNADRANTSFLGHSYFASSQKVLLDIRLMINGGLAPADRMPPLASRSLVFGHDHWSFSLMETKAAPGS